MKMSLANTGENHPRGMLGKTHSTGTKAKISETKGTNIFVYNSQSTLAYTFSSARKAAEHFKCSHPTIVSYVKNGKLFRDKWILSTFLITKN
jgi:group I intron endonuclease